MTLESAEKWTFKVKWRLFTKSNNQRANLKETATKCKKVERETKTAITVRTVRTNRSRMEKQNWSGMRNRKMLVLRFCEWKKAQKAGFDALYARNRVCFVNERKGKKTNAIGIGRLYRKDDKDVPADDDHKNQSEESDGRLEANECVWPGFDHWWSNGLEIEKLEKKYGTAKRTFKLKKKENMVNFS